MKRADLEEKQFFARWFKFLFIMLIISLIASMMASDIAYAYMEVHVIPGRILGGLVSIAYAVGLIVMAKYNDHYRTSGWATLLSIASSLALMLTGGMMDASMAGLFSVLIIFFKIFADFHEFGGHMEVTRNRFGRVSQQWSTLWKWTLAAYVVQIVSAAFLLIVPDIGAILTLIYALMVLVTGVLKMVMLYRTASFYAN